MLVKVPQTDDSPIASNIFRHTALRLIPRKYSAHFTSKKPPHMPASTNPTINTTISPDIAPKPIRAHPANPHTAIMSGMDSSSRLVLHARWI